MPELWEPLFVLVLFVVLWLLSRLPDIWPGRDGGGRDEPAPQAGPTPTVVRLRSQSSVSVMCRSCETVSPA